MDDKKNDDDDCEKSIKIKNYKIFLENYEFFGKKKLL